jgi:hypothetical protein
MLDFKQFYDNLKELSSEATREELEAAAACLLELESRKRENPLFYFEPNPKLVGFHTNRAAIRMVSGGNRSGKTEHISEEACNAALGYRPWVLRKSGLPIPSNPVQRPDRLPDDAIVFDGSGVRLRVPGTILLGTGLDLKKGIGETLHPKVESFLGREGGPFVKKVYWSHGQVPSKVILHNGSAIIYASAQQKGLSWESTNHTWYGLDEPIPKRIYSGVRRGAIDQAAPICFSFTPLGPNAAWMFRDLYSKADGRRIAVFNLSIFDNPWLPRKAVEEFANDPSISDVEKEARLFGRFLHLIDRIYPQFNEAVHIIPSFRPESDWLHGMVLDPHTVKPWAIAWFTVTPRGDIIFYREWPSSDFTKLRRDTRSPAEYAGLIRQIEGPRQADVRIIDPNYGGRADTVRGVHIPAVKDILAEYGLQFIGNINDDLNYGEARVRALLAYDTKQPLSQVNCPRIFFTENCQNLIASQLYYVADNKSAEDDMPAEDKRDETYKDFADLVRYVAVSKVAEGTLSDSWLNEHLYGPASSQGFGTDSYDGYLD